MCRTLICTVRFNNKNPGIRWTHSSTIVSSGWLLFNGRIGIRTLCCILFGGHINSYSAVFEISFLTTSFLCSHTHTRSLSFEKYRFSYTDKLLFYFLSRFPTYVCVLMRKHNRIAFSKIKNNSLLIKLHPTCPTIDVNGRLRWKKCNFNNSSVYCTGKYLS